MRARKKTRTAVLITGAAAVLLLVACAPADEPTGDGSLNVRIAGTITREVYENGGGSGSVSGPSFDIVEPPFQMRDFDIDPEHKVLVFLVSSGMETPVAVGTQGNESFSFVVTTGNPAELVRVHHLPNTGPEPESDDPDARFDEVRIFVDREDFHIQPEWELTFGALVDGGYEFVTTRYIYADRSTTVSGGYFGEGVQLAEGWNVLYSTCQGWLGHVTSIDDERPQGASFVWAVYRTLR